MSQFELQVIPGPLELSILVNSCTFVQIRNLRIILKSPLNPSLSTSCQSLKICQVCPLNTVYLSTLEPLGDFKEKRKQQQQLGLALAGVAQWTEGPPATR